MSDSIRRKDGWDKLLALSSFLSAVAIGVVGVFFTQEYKNREIHIAEAQEAFSPPNHSLKRTGRQRRFTAQWSRRGSLAVPPPPLIGRR